MKRSLLMMTAVSMLGFAACQPAPEEEEVPEVQELPEAQPVEPAAPAPMTGQDTMMMQPTDTMMMQPTDTMMQPMDTVQGRY